MISRIYPFTRLLTLALSAMATFAYGLEPTTPLARFSRQSWSIENGLPQNTVPVLMQSRSGYLWIGTELGLARFDGSAFEIVEHTRLGLTTDPDIRCLLDARSESISDTDSKPRLGADAKSDTGNSKDGSALWIGTADGLIRWRNGAPTLYSTSSGLPANSILGIAQTSDNTLWIWTEQGLARWNGTSFQSLADPMIAAIGTISSLAAASNGDLWVAGTDGVLVYRDRAWKRESAMAGGTSGTALVAPVSNGDVLIATSEGVALSQGNALISVLGKSALPPGPLSFLARLSDGTIAAASKSAVVLARSEADHTFTVQRFAVAGQLPGTRIDTLYADREGSLWIGTNHGLARLTLGNDGAVVQTLPPTDPLAVDATVSILEDREGDLWVGSETTGLHVLRDARFRMIGTSDGLSSDATTALVQDAKGFVWVGTRGNGLNRLPPVIGQSSAIDFGAEVGVNKRRGIALQDARITNLTSANGLLSDVILALAASPNGDVWVGTPDGLNRISGSNGKIDSFTSADGLPDDFIRSLLVEPNGALWIGTRRGLAHLTLEKSPARGIFQSLTRADGLGSDLIGALARTADGDLWIATLNGLSRLSHDSAHHDQYPLGRLHTYTTADGLSSNVITALDIASKDMIWIGTQDKGLDLWDGKRFRLVPEPDYANDTRGPAKAVDLPTAKDASHTSDRRYFPAVIHAVIHDEEGQLWIASDRGLTRASSKVLLTCLEHRPCDSTSGSVDFTASDGLRSRETSSNSHPTTARLRNGEIWFATPRGVAIVDPRHFAPMPPAPPVVIERFAIDDQIVDSIVDEPSSEIMRIAAGHLRFQFDYAGLSFAAPQKLRYEYMLEGFDHVWTDAGTRKTAYYTNIPPGTYRFLVRATFGRGGEPAAVNDAPQAALRFELLPHFYQTLWFWLLVLLLSAALILLVFRRRVLRVRRELGAVMAERNRIAREIHDTLAQGYVGISLQLEMLGELLRQNRADAAARLLTTTQGLVREGLDDARQSIWALRSQDATEHTLPIRLRRLVEKAQSDDLTATLEVHGAYRSLDPDYEKEILRVAQEAIQNVTRHARASRMNVRLDYGERSLQLQVTDDGTGFVLARASGGSERTHSASPILQAVKASGSHHYGLTGMQERAAVIHATIDIVSAPGEGTSVLMKVSAPEAGVRKEGEASEFSSDSQSSSKSKV